MIVTAIAVVVLIGLAVWRYAGDESETELAPTYLRSPTDFVEVAGVRLHVRDDGPKNAPAVIFLHGFGASLHTREPWATSPAGSLRVIRIDRPGIGLTGPDPTGDHADERSIAVLAALMDKLGIAKAVIVGNSIGGRIAWKFTAAQPTRVDKLVLISPDGFASPGFEYGKPPEVPAVMGLMRDSMPSFMVRMSMQPAYGDPKFMTPPFIERYRDMMLATGVRGAMMARMTQSILVPPEPYLQSITAPTLLMWGEKDGMIPFANSQDYLRVMKNAKLVSYPSLGHLPHEEGVAETIGALRAFLTANTPT